MEEQEKALPQETEKPVEKAEEKKFETTERVLRVRGAFVCDKAEMLLLPMAAVFGYLFVRLMYEVSEGVSMAICVAMVYIVTGIYCKAAKLTLNHGAETVIMTFLVIALTIPYILFDLSGGQLLLLFAALAVTAAMQLYTLLGARRFRFGDREYALDCADAVFVMPFANLGSSWMTVGQAGKKGIGRNVLLVLLGLVIALPLMAILVSLLFEADAAFANMCDNLLNRIVDHFSDQIFYILFAIPVAMVAFGVLYGLRYRKGIRKLNAPGTERSRILPLSVALGVLTPAVIIYIAYLVSQLAYFTSAFSGLLPADFTYAEYARRGFFELCALCVINLTITVALLTFVKAKNWFRKSFGTFFCLISLFLTATSIAKMVLYMDYYGLTPLRIHTTLFMAVIAVTFLSILIRLFAERFPLTQVIAVAAAAAVLTFGYMNAEKISLQYNLNAIETGKLEDTAYFAGFSREDVLYMNDGIEPILKEYEDIPKIAGLLNERHQYRKEEAKTLNWNLETYLAEIK